MLTTLRSTVALLAIVGLLHPSVALAREDVHVAPWSRVAPLLPGLLVTVELTGRGRVFGKALGATPDGLTMRVTGSSRGTRYPKGLQRIAAASIARVTLIETAEADVHWAATGAGIGGATVAPVAFYLGASGKHPEWLGLLALIGGAVLGGWVGHHFDRGRTVFVVTNP
jgi:hypothetical protein